MGRSFLSGVFLVFCISCSSLWGTRLEEGNPVDGLESLKNVMLYTISVWETYGTALLKAQITKTIQAERDPSYPDELRRERWEYIQECLEGVKARFCRSIEEAGSLIRLIQVIKDAPRPEGRLGFDGDTRLLEAERNYLLDTDPRL
jgi:hypothetical protein